MTPRSTDGFLGVLSLEQKEQFDAVLARLGEELGPRRMWHVNSTDRGGGVAEMLASLLPYPAGAGIPVGWLVLDVDDQFFRITKRLHNRLHDDPGDGGPLGPEERAVYDGALAPEAAALLDVVAPGDVVVLHDPQTAGLAPALSRHGVEVAWRSHIGTESPGAVARSAWDWIKPEVLAADAYIFTRPTYVWDGLPRAEVQIMAPCIDVLSPKNEPLTPATRDAILHASGLVLDRRHPKSQAIYTVDGRPHLVIRPVALIEEAPLRPDDRLVVQVSRWDRLKDPVGLVRAFAEHGPTGDDVHLVVAGPSLEGVTDDPEGVAVFDEVVATWNGLEPRARRRVHLACIPMDDPDENAAVVNALQRRAAIVVQKSIAEGFGLTVTEAMWKKRPVVASRVGGVQDQIVHGHSGLLVDDPLDLAAFGRAFRDLLANPGRATAMGLAAHQRVCDRYLPVNHFAAEAELVARLRLGHEADLPTPR